MNETAHEALYQLFRKIPDARPEQIERALAVFGSRPNLEEHLDRLEGRMDRLEERMGRLEVRLGRLEWMVGVLTALVLGWIISVFWMLFGIQARLSTLEVTLRLLAERV